jgi:hypothetical protein
MGANFKVSDFTALKPGNFEGSRYELSSFFTRAESFPDFLSSEEASVWFRKMPLPSSKILHKDFDEEGVP